jgi:threonine/homoserine/homoserine lactone efflux protein
LNGRVPNFVAFLGVSLLIIVTPGQDTVLTVRNTLAGGRAGGVFTAIGVSAGQLIWTLAASAGVAALLAAYEPAFFAIRLAGAVYLVYLGAQTLRSALEARSSIEPDALATPARRRRPAVVFVRQGVLSNLGNPKMVLFFTSLLPQFAPPGSGFGGLVGLGVVFCLITLTWLTCYSVVVAAVGHVLRRPGVRRTIEGVTGATLMALGFGLAAESR